MLVFNQKLNFDLVIKFTIVIWIEVVTSLQRKSITFNKNSTLNYQFLKVAQSIDEFKKIPLNFYVIIF